MRDLEKSKEVLPPNTFRSREELAQSRKRSRQDSREVVNTGIGRRGEKKVGMVLAIVAGILLFYLVVFAKDGPKEPANQICF